ncbi:MAG: peroxiredoxin [Myxococcales bacterium]|nr:peroxiredoxin [Myxococcales bacterium]
MATKTSSRKTTPATPRAAGAPTRTAKAPAAKAQARAAKAPERASKASPASKATKAPARAAKAPAPAAKATKAAPARPAGKAPTPSAAAPGVGDPAPDFSLAADDGKTYTLAGLRGSRFVLYFYPRDSTPGCTTEACDFRDRLPTFGKAKVPVLGVSGDSLRAHANFRGKHSLNFPLLSDPDHRVAAAYGAYGTKMMYGRAVEGIIRSTFVVGPSGTIEAVWRPVKVPGHAEAVLQSIRGK